MYGGRYGFCLDIDFIPCEWVSCYYRMLKYIPANQYMVIVPYDHSVEHLLEPNNHEPYNFSARDLLKYREQKFFHCKNVV